MYLRFPRAARKSALVCLALAVVAIVAGVLLASRAAARAEAAGPHLHVARTTTRADGVRGKYPTRPLTLREGDRALFAFPPAARAKAKPGAVVYLHGIHGRPENGCPFLRGGASEIGWLVCPAANERLANGTFSWAGSALDKRDVVVRAERAAYAAGADPSAPSVLVGFSQGAWVADELVRARLGRYRGLVLLSAEITPQADALRAAGVTRVVLAAGELDAAFAPMKRAAARLAREAEGAIVVRFVSLGRVGHTYEAETAEVLREAIAWTGAADEAS